MNKLENALLAASSDDSKRIKFYKVLTESDIFFIPYSRTPETVNGVTIEGQAVQIQQIQGEDGKPYTPFFSSLYYLQKSISSEVKYAQCNSKAFFNLIKGSEAVLNPGCDMGKIFLKQEIINIVNGDALKGASQITIEKETPIKIGKPANPPEELMKRLADLYETMPNVLDGYLVWVHAETRNEPPHSMVLIKCKDDDREPFVKSGEIVRELMAKSNEFVDFIGDGNDGMKRTIKRIGIHFYKSRRKFLFF